MQSRWRSKLWWVAAGLVLLAGAVVVWLVTRPPTMFVLGVYALDAEHALVATRRNEKADTRFWLAKVQVGVGTVWATELPASVSAPLGLVRATRHGDTLVVALESDRDGGVIRAPSLATFDLSTGALQSEHALPPTWSDDFGAPLTLGRFAIFAGSVMIDPACRGALCLHEERLVVFDAAGGSAFAICPTTSHAECDLKVELWANRMLMGLGERLALGSNSKLVLVDLAAREVWRELAGTSLKCRDGDDPVVVDASGPARLDPRGELVRLVGLSRYLVGCARVAGVHLWSDFMDGTLQVIATEPAGQVRWRIADDDQTLAVSLRFLRRAPVDAGRTRYVPVSIFVSEKDKRGTRWLDLVTGRLGPPVWPDKMRNHDLLWPSPARVVHRVSSSLAIYDAEGGKLIDVLDADASESNIAEGRLWLADQSGPWTTIDALPWVVLDPETLAVVGAGGDWRPRSLKAKVEARFGPYPDAER